MEHVAHSCTQCICDTVNKLVCVCVYFPGGIRPAGSQTLYRRAESSAERLLRAAGAQRLHTQTRRSCHCPPETRTIRHLVLMAVLWTGVIKVILYFPTLQRFAISNTFTV